MNKRKYATSHHNQQMRIEQLEKIAMDLACRMVLLKADVAYWKAKANAGRGRTGRWN